MDSRCYKQPSTSSFEQQFHIKRNKIQMTQLISDERYREMVYYAEDQELQAFWTYLQHDLPSFDERREAFLYILQRLLEERRIRLVHMYTRIPIEGSIEEQIQLFRRVFPKTEIEMDNGIWFLSRECPGGPEWARA
jgi:hypothetical protein